MPSMAINYKNKKALFYLKIEIEIKRKIIILILILILHIRGETIIHLIKEGLQIRICTIDIKVSKDKITNITNIIK
jgi:hypothetical protein